MLEEAGPEVVVVNGAHCRNIPGRRTDMKDCQWLAVDSYESHQKQVARRDALIAEVVQEMSAGKPAPDLGRAGEPRHNAIVLKDPQGRMARIFGRNLTKPPCLNCLWY